MRLRVLASVFCFGLMTFFAPAVEAAYDMSGKWLVTSSGAPHFKLDLTQSVGTLSQPVALDFLKWDGTIDEGTGAFFMSARTHSPIFPCGDWTLTGTVAADGTTFAATLHYTFDSRGGCDSDDIVATGTRCGNNQLDDGESCDFGDATDGDCCSSTCTLAEAESPCTSDGNECTSDVCNAAGTCQHLPESGACTRQGGCGTGECSAGTCSIAAVAPPGVPCDRDGSVCTIEACDGAGHCQWAGKYIECSPCGVCDRVDGCVRPDEPECYQEEPDLIALTVTTSPHGRRNRFRLLFQDFGYDLPGNVGNPTDATRYTVCLYEEDGALVRPVFGAVVPMGADCSGQGCWQPHGYESFLYKGKTGAAGGIHSMSVDPFRGFRIKGAGVNLSLPTVLPTSSPLTPVIFSGEDAYTRRCWSHGVTSIFQSPLRFRGEFRAGP